MAKKKHGTKKARWVKPALAVGGLAVLGGAGYALFRAFGGGVQPQGGPTRLPDGCRVILSQATALTRVGTGVSVPLEAGTPVVVAGPLGADGLTPVWVHTDSSTIAGRVRLTDADLALCNAT
jgi:hypothetical protein